MQGLSRLSLDEESRLELLDESLLDLHANDPEKRIQHLNLHSVRVQALVEHIKAVETILSVRLLTQCSMPERNINACERKRKDYGRLHCRQGFWLGLAQNHGLYFGSLHANSSQELAYLDQSFPVVDEGASCVLCQQDLDHAAGTGSRSSSRSLNQPPNRSSDWPETPSRNFRRHFADLKVKTDSTDETIEEIRIEHEIWRVL